MRYITFTDHDSVDAYEQFGWDREGLVPGVEVKVRDYENIGHTVHVNVFAFDRRQFIQIDDIARQTGNLELFVSYLQEEGLPFSYNHPFWFEFGETPNLQVIPTLFELFPVVEYNMQRVRRKNHLTMKLAEKHRKGVISTTDSHTGQIGTAYTLARGGTFLEYFDNIRKGEFFLVARDLTVEVMTDQMVCWLESLLTANGELAGKNIATGFNRLDEGLRAYMEGRIDPHSAGIRFLRSAVFLASKSRIPALLYLRSQKVYARHLVRRMAALGAA
jgi:predicted metal-dependent phosphoesterase TrpH